MYKEVGIEYRPGKLPKSLGLKRSMLNKYIAELSGHGNYWEYHNRFKHNTELHCACWDLRTPGHMVQCTRTQRLKVRWPKPPEPKARMGGQQPRESLWSKQLRMLDFKCWADHHKYWIWLLRNPTEFGEFCKATQFFTKICPPFEEARGSCCQQQPSPDPSELDEEELDLDIVPPVGVNQQ